MAAPSSDTGQEDLKVTDDYYAILNVARHATSEEITNAFRRLSKIYHPDKHQDASKKQDAEILFNKIRNAHDVLTDPHKRAIYDTLGVEGLDTRGWQLIPRTKTPQEIREEYERLAKEQEERKLQQRTNPKGTISVEIDATDVFDTYYDEEDEDELYEDEGFFPNLEIGTMVIRQSVEAPINEKDTTTFSGTIMTKNGRGDGTLAGSWRHIFSPTLWTEVQMAIGSGFNLSGKGVKTLDQKHFVSFQADLQPTPRGIRPGCAVVLARQLGKHTVGYLTYKEGHTQSMCASFAWSSNSVNLTADLQFGIPNSFVGVGYVYKFTNGDTKIKGSVRLGTLMTSVMYGCETKISQHNFIGATMTIGHPQGVVLKLSLHRGQQSFLFPIQLSGEIVPSAIFYGTTVPIIGFFVFKKFVIEPYKNAQKKAEADKVKETNRSKINELRKHAAAAISLMQETYQRCRDQEEAKNGLVLVEAVYGNLKANEDSQSSGPVLVEVADVVVPLQCLVKDSRLILAEGSKASLPGFYDPCLGEEKYLRINYKFRNQDYQCIINDTQALRIPMEKHLVRVT